MPVLYGVIYIGDDSNPDVSHDPPGPPGLAWGDDRTLYLRSRVDEALVTVEYRDTEPDLAPRAEVAYRSQVPLGGRIQVSSPTVGYRLTPWAVPSGRANVRIDFDRYGEEEHWRVVYWPALEHERRLA